MVATTTYPSHGMDPPSITFHHPPLLVDHMDLLPGVWVVEIPSVRFNTWKKSSKDPKGSRKRWVIPTFSRDARVSGWVRDRNDRCCKLVAISPI